MESDNKNAKNCVPVRSLRIPGTQFFLLGAAKANQASLWSLNGSRLRKRVLYFLAGFRVFQHGIPDSGDAAPEGRIRNVAQPERDRSVSAVLIGTLRRLRQSFSCSFQQPGVAAPAGGFRQGKRDACISKCQIVRLLEGQCERA